jgi:protein SCO1/2
MGAASKKIQMAGWGLLLITLALVVGGYFRVSEQTDSQRVPQPVLSTLSKFSLTNELGQPITLDNLRGQVCLVDVIFTRCPGPCPKLSQRMSELQASLPTNLPVKFVSLTVDPDFDTPPILKTYGRRYGAASGRWLFLTGTKSELYKVIVNGLKLVAVPTPTGGQKPDEDFFVHSTKFVLIDGRGRVRAYYDGLDPEAKRRILGDLEALAKEPSS